MGAPGRVLGLVGLLLAICAPVVGIVVSAIAKAQSRRANVPNGFATAGDHRRDRPHGPHDRHHPGARAPRLPAALPGVPGARPRVPRRRRRELHLQRMSIARATAPALPVRTNYRPERVIALGAVLGPLAQGSGDPTIQRDGPGWWLAMATPAGDATLHLRPRDGGIDAIAWGPGADRAIDDVPALLGAGGRRLRLSSRACIRWSPSCITGSPDCGCRVPDGAAIPDPGDPGAEGDRDRGEARVAGPGAPAWFPRPGAGAGGDAGRAGRRGLAPCPVLGVASGGCRPPSGRTPSCGSSRRWPGTPSSAPRGWMPQRAVRRLRGIPGIGVWTAHETVQRSHGDPDSVSTGDLHLPKLVGTALAGRRVDDDGMMQLLEPFRGSPPPRGAAHRAERDPLRTLRAARGDPGAPQPVALSR